MGWKQSRQEDTYHPTHMFGRLFRDLLPMVWRGCTSATRVIDNTHAASCYCSMVIIWQMMILADRSIRLGYNWIVIRNPMMKTMSTATRLYDTMYNQATSGGPRTIWKRRGVLQSHHFGDSIDTNTHELVLLMCKREAAIRAMNRALNVLGHINAHFCFISFHRTKLAQALELFPNELIFVKTTVSVTWPGKGPGHRQPAKILMTQFSDRVRPQEQKKLTVLSNLYKWHVWVIDVMCGRQLPAKLVADFLKS